MVSTRGKAAQATAAVTTSENINNDDSDINNGGKGKGLGYADLRDQRIKENKERMQKLGIFELSLKLKSHLRKPKRNPKNVSSEKKSLDNPLPLSDPPRRSSRLKSLSPVSYVEQPTKAKRNLSMDVEIRLQAGSKPEVYTEEHEKLLGDCKTAWTLFVDGYGKDGKRIYDSERGETCHQCRQKTLGHHSHCSKCNLVQGQFCGDCLYMRYGENVIEVSANPDWICPVCRGICNCSLCRKSKGWAPTGNLYRKVTRLGFKSVAHYLFQTCRSQTQSDNSDAESLISEEGALPSADKKSQGFSHNESLNAAVDNEDTNDRRDDDGLQEVND